MISAGRVLIVPRGNWNKDTTYHMLDMVNYNGYAYLAKRTVIGIEPEGHPDEWHNMLAINEIIEKAMADVLAESVGKLLEERFAELLSEARYVTNLFDDYDVPSFVRWDGYTENTPYKAGLTVCYEGFALVHGKFNLHHTVSAWVTGGERNECFIHTVSDGTASGWDRTISASGGTMVGPLGLGGGTGSISADSNGTFVEAKNNSISRRVKVTNPSATDVALEDALKFITDAEGKAEEFNIVGEHNVDLLSKNYGYAKIKFGTYEGTGEHGKEHPNKLEFDFPVKVLLLDGKYVAFNGKPTASYAKDDDSNYNITLTWNEDNSVTWYASGGASAERVGAQCNKKDTTYWYVAIG
jgi:hypothetical protein